MAGVRILIQFKADSRELADKQMADLNERAKHSQGEKGCKQFEVFRSIDNPQKWALVEHWESQAALDEHRQAAGGPPPQGPAGITREREIYEHTPA